VSIALSGLADALSGLATDSVTLLAAGSGLTLALAPGIVACPDIYSILRKQRAQCYRKIFFRFKTKKNLLIAKKHERFFGKYFIPLFPKQSNVNHI
jgi:hypothetical protein